MGIIAGLCIFVKKNIYFDQKVDILLKLEPKEWEFISMTVLTLFLRYYTSTELSSSSTVGATTSLAVALDWNLTSRTYGRSAI
jgi:hypothetical protein